MKIAVVASPVTPLRPAQLGGAQAFICDLAAGLVAKGHEVTLHCTEGSEVAGVKLVTVPAPLDASAALVMPGGAPPPQAPGVAAALGAMFDAIAAERADVVSQHAFDAPAFDLARGLPVLHTLHLPPIVDAVLAAARQVPASQLATVSRSCLESWRAAEAQMAGCPVAAYRRGAMPEVVEEGVSGFLAEPDDVSGLALAVRKCLALDRAAVMSSAQRRLGLDAALDRYETALRLIAR